MFVVFFSGMGKYLVDSKLKLIDSSQLPIVSIRIFEYISFKLVCMNNDPFP